MSLKGNIVDKVKRFLKSAYGPLLIGVIFTAITTLIVNFVIQTQIVSRQQKFEVYTRKLNGAEQVINETMSLINSRQFSLQRVYWAYEYGDNDIAEKDYKAYRAMITDWNAKDMSYKLRLNMYLGSQAANDFLDNTSHSVYGQFYRAHQKLLQWRSCLHEVCDNDAICATQRCSDEQQKTQKTLDELGNRITDFAKELYSEYDVIASRL